MNIVYYKIEDWIGGNYVKIGNLSLSQNPYAIFYMIDNNIDLNVLSISKNTNDLFIRDCLLKRYKIHINWRHFSMNSADEAVTYLLKKSR
jgi:hypothetical protein